MEGGARRIPVSAFRVLHLAPTVATPYGAEPPPYMQRLIEQLGAFDTGTIPCAGAARIAGIGIKAMRSGLRSGRIPGGRLVGGSWLVTVDAGEWITEPQGDQAGRSAPESCLGHHRAPELDRARPSLAGSVEAEGFDPDIREHGN